MSWRIGVPLTDLRREPVAAAPGFRMRDQAQESQLLYGEAVRIAAEAGEWAKVEALEQQRFSPDQQWHGYSGWVQRAHLVEVPDLLQPNLTVHAYRAVLYADPDSQQEVSFALMGSRLVGKEMAGAWWLVALPDGREAAVRQRDVISEPALSPGRLLISRAMPFLGTPYFWGGCSPSLQREGFIHSGVDCSGLVHLLYRSVGIEVPRDAHDQWLWATKISADRIERGDLLFTAPLDKPDRVDHVMLYVQEDTVLEASLTAGMVRFVTLKDKVGCSLSEMRHGAQPEAVTIDFGRVIPN